MAMFNTIRTLLLVLFDISVFTYLCQAPQANIKATHHISFADLFLQFQSLLRAGIKVFLELVVGDIFVAHAALALRFAGEKVIF
jgi:hypothetical protein